MRLITPARCTGKMPEDLTKPYYVSEPKMDGSRYALYIGGNPYETGIEGNTLLSRRVSVVDMKHVNKTKNVPHITHRYFTDLDGTILDGEVMGKDFPTTNSVMNSAPAVAIEKQKIDKLSYYAFDILSFRGKDVSTLPLEQRRKILVEVVNRMNSAYVKAIEQVSSNHEEHFARIVAAGGEGIIIKDTRQPYGLGWSKKKRSADVSCIVSGFKPGNGKYKGGVGSVAVSVWSSGALLEIGFASGFSDDIRSDMSANPSSYMGRVLDIFAHEIRDDRLRHPTFHRMRDDLNPLDCTLDKVKKDLTFNVKSRRSKHDF